MGVQQRISEIELLCCYLCWTELSVHSCLRVTHNPITKPRKLTGSPNHAWIEWFIFLFVLSSMLYLRFKGFCWNLPMKSYIGDKVAFYCRKKAANWAKKRIFKRSHLWSSSPLKTLRKKKVSVDQMPLLVFLCSLPTLLVFTSTHSWLSFSSGCSDNGCLLFSERGHSNCLKLKEDTHNFCENEVCLAITYTPPS